MRTFLFLFLPLMITSVQILLICPKQQFRIQKIIPYNIASYENAVLDYFFTNSLYHNELVNPNSELLHPKVGYVDALRIRGYTL